MPLAQKIRDKIKSNAFILWYGLIYLEFKFELHTDLRKKSIPPSKTDCKTIIRWFFNPNLMKYITPIIFSLFDVLIIKYKSEQRKEIENFGWIDLYLYHWQLYAHGYFN